MHVIPASIICLNVIILYGFEWSKSYQNLMVLCTDNSLGTTFPTLTKYGIIIPTVKSMYREPCAEYVYYYNGNSIPFFYFIYILYIYTYCVVGVKPKPFAIILYIRNDLPNTVGQQLIIWHAVKAHVGRCIEVQPSFRLYT